MSILQELQIDILHKEVMKMAHDKVYVVCENMCMEEGYTKEQIDNKFDDISLEIPDGGVSTEKLADKSVTTAKLANQSVTGTQIKDYSISNWHMRQNSVWTEHILNQNVTAEKLATDAVYTIGTYVGDGNDDLIINCGFVPRVVIIMGCEGAPVFKVITEGMATAFQGLDSDKTDLGREVWMENKGAGAVPNDDIVNMETWNKYGFKVHDLDGTNMLDAKYTYIAFR